MSDNEMRLQQELTAAHDEINQLCSDLTLCAKAFELYSNDRCVDTFTHLQRTFNSPRIQAIIN